MLIDSNKRSWFVELPFDTFAHRKMTENAQSCDIPKHVHILDSQLPIESGGGWGLFVFCKYFLVDLVDD